jgi:hypothetical protein
MEKVHELMDQVHGGAVHQFTDLTWKDGRSRIEHEEGWQCGKAPGIYLYVEFSCHLHLFLN